MFEKIFLKIKNTFINTRAKIRNIFVKDYYRMPKDVEYFEGSLYDALVESSIKYPFNVAIRYDDLEITFKDLIKRVNKCAKSLKYYGVEKGDKVTICMPNTPEEVIMFYAINEVGAIANMVHPQSSEKEMEYVLNKSNSKVMLCIDIAYPTVKEIVKNTQLEKVIVVSATKSMTKLINFFYWLTSGRKINVKEDKIFISYNHFYSKSNLIEKDPYEEVKSTDPAVILYSGGTTGKSKGVLISNYSFNAQALQSKYVEPEALKPGNSFLTFLPNFHAFGIGICTHTPLYNGMCAILIPKFNAKKIKNYIRKYRFNILCGVPTFYDYISKIKFRTNELKCIKLCVCGGDSISSDLKVRINEFLKKYGSETDIKVGYGLTEASGVICLCPEGIKDSDAIGYSFPDNEFSIRNPETFERILDDSDGEICISGPNIMIGYLDEPYETQGVLVNENGKVWLRTGDLGYMDKNKLIHYRTRIKRMIITSGYNVYPSLVEEYIQQLDFVKNCAVVGIPDPNKGEIVKAFIVIDEHKNEFMAKNTIQKHLKKYLARYEQPREYKFIDELPLTKMGKIAYKELEKLK